MPLPLPLQTKLIAFHNTERYPTKYIRYRKDSHRILYSFDYQCGNWGIPFSLFIRSLATVFRAFAYFWPFVRRITRSRQIYGVCVWLAFCSTSCFSWLAQSKQLTTHITHQIQRPSLVAFFLLFLSLSISLSFALCMKQIEKLVSYFDGWKHWQMVRFTRKDTGLR